jgi:protocatechuate 3,4-dioxygenase beta subunit
MSADNKHHITRRQSLALLGSGGAGLLLAGTSAGWGTAFAHTTQGDDYVVNAAAACTLAPEQEEGPFYVALDDIRADIVGGQIGLPMQLEITIIDSLTCKPLKDAAVDVWHCNATGVYSDISSRTRWGRPTYAGSSSPTSTVRSVSPR